MDVSLSLRILQALRMSTDVPIDYLVSRLGSTRSEIERRINDLQRERLVVRREDRVRLETTAKSF